jgi:tRNA ligase
MVQCTRSLLSILKSLKQQQKFASAAVTPKKKPLEYMSVVVPTMYILDILETAFDGQKRNKAIFFRQMQEARRIQQEFHVTLIHKAVCKQHPHLWDHYASLHQAAGAAGNRLGTCDVRLERVSLPNSFIMKWHILMHVVGCLG